MKTQGKIAATALDANTTNLRPGRGGDRPPPADLRAGQLGITGLETDIVLIAFVVVASVFAFAVLTTGLRSSEESTNTVRAGMKAAQTTSMVRGPVLAHKSATTSTIDMISFAVTTAEPSIQPVDLSASTLGVMYIDKDQVVNLPPEAWQATWRSGSGDQLHPGERVSFDITLTGHLDPELGRTKEFTLLIQPPSGTELVITRTTPAELTTVVNLY